MRECYGLFVVNGILFNHESPRRGMVNNTINGSHLMTTYTGLEFVSRKITLAVAGISLGSQEALELGNLEARRDWGHAKDFVKGMHMILKHHEPVDFVLATGISRSVRQFVEEAFSFINIRLVWEGKGADEIAKDRNTGMILVKVKAELFRPNDIPMLCGSARKAEEELGWSANVSFKV
ncbi:GDP-mannose 46-dehydratase [Pyrenophora tritici-repentis]|nr:GDP-mannose 4,6-dehydratase [Pyrenophora tritici-repentis]KAI2486168.1 GDP-mannose 46-dehydratase [Pyrenophora tritici-repentis]